METLIDMQCMWFELECAFSYYHQGKLGEALKKCHQVEKVPDVYLLCTVYTVCVHVRACVCACVCACVFMHDTVLQQACQYGITDC